MPNPFDQFDSAASGPVYGPPPAAPKPRDPLAMRKDEIDIQKGEADIGNIPLENEKLRLDMEKTRFDMAKAQEPSETKLKLIGRAKGLELLEKQINDLDTLYQRNFKGGGLGAIVEYLPGQIRPENAEFDNASRGLMSAIATAQGLTAQQQNTPTELEIRFGPYIPKSTDRDEVIVSKLSRLRDLLAAQRSELSAQGGASSPSANAPAAPDNHQPPSPPSGPAYAPPPTGPTSGMASSTDGFNDTPDNASAAFWTDAARNGVPYGTALRQWHSDVRARGLRGVTPPPPQAYHQVAAYMRQHPDIQYQPFSSVTRTPLNAVESAANAVASSGPGAFAGHFADQATAGAPTRLAGDEGQYYQAVTQAEHPTASTLGDIAGSTAGMLGTEAGLAGIGMRGGLGREVLANTGYGAVSGGVQNQDNPVLGAVEGGAAGLGGTLAGNAVARGAASLVSPTGGRLAQLYENGVRPTPGQRFSESGVLGRMLNAAEEHLSSVPIIGSAIRGARQEARDQFQGGAFNQALGEIGDQLPKGTGLGTDAHVYTQKAFDRVYDRARGSMQIHPDQQLGTDLTHLNGQVQTLAEPSIKRFQSIIQNVVMRRAGTTIDGQSYKKIQSEIGRIVRGIRKSPSGDGELADALDGLSGVLDSAARRHSAPDAVALMDAADRGYAKFVQIENASAKGGVAKEAGTFSPNDFAASVKGNGSRVRSKAYNQGQGLMQDYAEAGKSLSDRIPNSGTPERQMTALAATGGVGFLEPTTLGVLGLIGTLYAPGLRKIMTGGLKPRGPAARAIADAVRKRARLAGTVGSAAAVQGTSPDQ